VGLVHSLAGSGALTAIAFAEVRVPGTAPVHDRLDPGSIAGMALAPGARRGRAARSSSGRVARARALALVTSSLSITVGVMGSIRHGRGGEWRRRTFLTSRPIRLASTRACTVLHPVFPDSGTPG
jgi:hypothetical protein